MKKIFHFGMVGALTVLISIPLAYPQQDKEALLKRQAQADVAADSNEYVIGPEDVLYIHVWKEEAITRTVLVRMDGKISLPLVDDVQAAGFTPLQLKVHLTQKLKDFVDEPTISVVVVEANSFKIFVSGEVKSPGVYRLKSETSLLQLIVMVGGFTEWANQKKILIIRKEDGKERRITVNYKKIISEGDQASNIILRPGDYIMVP